VTTPFDGVPITAFEAGCELARQATLRVPKIYASRLRSCSHRLPPSDDILHHDNGVCVCVHKTNRGKGREGAKIFPNNG
jgi:hypothetical protein